MLRMEETLERPVRVPDAAQVSATRIAAFQNWLTRRYGLEFEGYDSLWQFSVQHTAAFWDAVREYFEIPLRGTWPAVLADPTMPGAREAWSETGQSLVDEGDLEYLGRESYMPLFVVLRPGCALHRLLIERIRGEIRDHLSPRHIPSEIFQVAEIPRTLTGKKLELPIGTPWPIPPRLTGSSRLQSSMSRHIASEVPIASNPR